MTDRDSQRNSEADAVRRFVIEVFPDSADEVGRMLHRNHRDGSWPTLVEMNEPPLSDEEFERLVALAREHRTAAA